MISNYILNGDASERISTKDRKRDNHCLFWNIYNYWDKYLVISTNKNKGNTKKKNKIKKLFHQYFELPNLELHCWDQHLLLLLPLLLPDLDHHPGPAGHQGARAQLRSGLEDQEALAGLQEARWLLLGPQLVPKSEGKECGKRDFFCC